ncbi:MAG: hypothetical protein AAB871_02495 [Patescibacteria group bacterium]
MQLTAKKLLRTEEELDDFFRRLDSMNRVYTVVNLREVRDDLSTDPGGCYIYLSEGNSAVVVRVGYLLTFIAPTHISFTALTKALGYDGSQDFEWAEKRRLKGSPIAPSAA